ncbi:MAG: hypothetical protein HZA28_07345 [Candidatus Omnitrophica bacterium]|nr:hypothetical protein [Candidatus Omnitrophota bacterium]
MNKNFPQPGFRQFVPAFLLSFIAVFFIASSLHADNILQKAVGPAGKSSKALTTPSRSAVGPKAGKELLPARPSGFGTGFDTAQKPAWSKWQPMPEFDVEGPESYETWTLAGPATNLKPLDAYKISPNENPVTVALKIDDMIGGLSPAVVNAAVNDVTQDNLPQTMTRMADEMTGQTNRVYGDIQGMYADIDAMKAQLARNYETYNNSEQTRELAQKFNAQSDAMAGRAAGMRGALEGMTQRVQLDRDLLDGMFDVLEEMGQNGQEAAKYYDQLAKHVNAVATQFEAMTKELTRQGLEARGAVDGVRQYLSRLQEYVKGAKPYAASELGYLGEVKKYLQNTRQYLDGVLTDLEGAAADMKETEEYFRKAKIDAGPSREIIPQEEAATDACEGAKKDGLSPLKECAKSCRTVCRWKEKVEGVDCYECPSGSPDSCFDVGAWPDNHPWCRPGGVCHADPMMYCVPFGTIGPNLEKLSCTNCKKRPDECWSRVGDGTMTYTNCMTGCWDGKCVYKGKYKETEWDGKPEFIHCYKCETPPGPPSCEDLGWGTTWKSDCEKNCPEPGECQSKEHKVPGAPPVPPGPPAPPEPPDGNPPDGQQGGGGGQQGGGQGGGAQGGGTTQGGGQPQGGGGSKANPPGGTPQQPAGGGGAIAPTGSLSAGAPSQGGQQGAPSGGQGTGARQAPPAPSTTQPKQPPQPNPGGQPNPPGNPPQPPDNPEISFYRNWLTETREQIKEREDILADKKEGDAVKEEAARQLESLTREREHVEKRIEEEEEKELERQRQASEAQQRQETAARTQTRVPDYAAETRRLEREWHLKKLKEATDALRAKLEEARDVLTARRERLQKIDEEIARLERENQHYTEGQTTGNVDKTAAETHVRDNTARINQLKQMKAELAKKLNELQRQYDEEFRQLKTEYQRRLWAVDAGARRKAEAERMDEYFERYNELQRREQSRELRRQTFESMVQGLEGALAQAEADGDSGRADELKRQIENIKRGQAEWDATQERQIENLKDQIQELELRNGYEGVGPDSPEDLSKKLGEYETRFQNEIDNAQRAISELEKMGTRSAEQDRLLSDLRIKANGLRGALDGVRARQQEIQQGSPLSAEERQRIHDSATRVAAGAMDQDADKSFARLAMESIAEEAVHNMNPYVMAKKSLAFGVGMAQGVGSAVVGLVELGVGAVAETLDTVAEAIAVDLGAEDGWIFGTENLQAINNLPDAISSNVNFDGLLRGVVAAGGAIDAQLNELAKGDIDWNTAKFGGRVAGETVVGDAVIAGALGKASTLIRGADEASDAVRAGQRAVGAAEDAAEAGRTAERAGGAAGHLDDTVRLPPFEPPPSGAASHLDDTAKFPPFEPPPATTAVDDAADATRLTKKADDVPASTPKETPPARGPPATSVGPNSNLTYTTPDGKQVSLHTGEKLGQGSTSTAYVNADNPKQVIRVTDIGGDVAEAPTLDRVGRQAVESIQRPDGPVRIVEKGNPVTVTDPNSPLRGKVVEVVERVENGSADQFLAKQGGQMTSGQAQAFDAACKDLNRSGYAWLDNHTGNYGFERIPNTEDGWRVVVLDPGGIVPMKGATLAERAENARAIQSRVNLPTEDFSSSMGFVKNPKVRKMVAGEQWGKILDECGPMIDIDSMGLRSPTDVGFYPGGLLDFPEAQKLFRTP